ncbi:MAG: lipocalin family protein [Saprospiraceae bacterium]|nr:lipocalin family protein [Bacteroidia bacterium]NNF22018.1 lipocalin family protein [Saprospiraceae bacterium]
MSNLLKVLLLSMFSFYMISLMSCGSEEQEGPMISDDFSLIGKWYFQHVEVDAVIGGLPQSETDETPEGFIEFFEDGTGFSEFLVDAAGFSYGKDENIEWERAGSVVTIVEEDGDIDTWNILIADNQNITAEWAISFGALNQGTITANLSK